MTTTARILDGIAHGLTGYDHHRCRCATCTAARRSYDVERRARLREERDVEREEERASRPEHPVWTAYKAMLALGLPEGVVQSLPDWPTSVWRTCAEARGIPWEVMEPLARTRGAYEHDWVEEERGSPVDPPSWVYPEGHPERERAELDP
jgi:hypothetical protein